jgi:hypothetical protein
MLRGFATILLTGLSTVNLSVYSTLDHVERTDRYAFDIPISYDDKVRATFGSAPHFEHFGSLIRGRIVQNYETPQHDPGATSKNRDLRFMV